MDVSDYVALDALGLAALLHKREVSAREVAEAAHEAADHTREDLNFLVRFTPELVEEALDAPATYGRPFSGVPFLIKDIAVPLRGIACEMGSRLAEGMISDHDGYLAQRVKAAGLVTLGLTATPEFGFSCTTEPVKGGPTRNPWDLDRMAGGSSGGSAAAVAAGVVPVAHASDAAGSIRIPAACCGLVGFKPSRGRTPFGPSISGGPFGHYSDHVVSRTVTDSAAMLDALAGPEPGELFQLAAPVDPFLGAAHCDPRPLRIALVTEAPNGVAVDPELCDATIAAARHCEALGHIVEPATLPYDWEAFFRMSRVVHNLWRPGRIEQLSAQFGRPIDGDMVEEINLTGYEVGKRLRPEEIVAALADAHAMTRDIAAFMANYDIVLQPVNSAPALPLGSIPTDGMGWSFDRYLQAMFDYCAFTGIYNITGQPAVSLPLAETRSGLPLGIQFAARFGEDSLLFSLAGQFERTMPWHDRRSPVHRALMG